MKRSDTSQQDRLARRDLMLLRLTPQERTALRHLRGFHHLADVCPVCKAETHGIQIGRRLAMQEITTGDNA